MVGQDGGALLTGRQGMRGFVLHQEMRVTVQNRC